ncbi:MAG: YceD family protein [bacterium]
MKISIAALRLGVHEFEFDEPPEKWGLENHPHLRALVHLTVQLEKGPTAIYVRNHIRTIGHFTCDRCLEEFDQVVEDTGRAVFSSDQNLVGPHEDEIRVHDPRAQEIDLTEDIRDLLLLSLPGKLLCQEDCQGLCAGCGANLNVEKCRCTAKQADPRWQPLQTLLHH